MTVAWQKIELPMGFGIDETQQKYVSAPPGLATLINGRIDKDGQINIRQGYDAVASPPGTPLWLFKYSERLYCTYSTATVAVDGVVNACAALDDASQRFDPQGGAPFTNALTEATIRDRITVARDTSIDVGGVDFVLDETTKQIVVAWIQARPGGGLGFAYRVFGTVLDLETFAIIKPIQEISTGPAIGVFCDQCRLVKEGTTVHVVYSTAAANILRTKDYNLTTHAWGADTVLFNDLNGQPAWDACEALTNAWCIAYRDTTPRLVVAQMAGAASAGAAVTAEDPVSIGIFANGGTLPSGTIWVAYHRNATDLRCKVYDLSLGVTLAATTVEAVAGLALTIGICEMSSSQALIVWSTNGLLTQRTTSKFRTITTAGALGTQNSRYSLLLASTPVVYSGGVYANFLFSGLTDTNPALYTVAICTTTNAVAALPQFAFRVVAVWMQGFAGYVPPAVAQVVGAPPTHLKHIGSLSEHLFPTLVRTHIVNQKVDGQNDPRILGRHGVDLCVMDLLDRIPRRSAECGKNLFLSGGKTQVFDGMNLVDHGMYYPPEDSLGVANNTTPGGLSAGSYQVALVWQFETLHGVVRSQPTLVLDSGTGNPVIVAAAADGIDLTIQPLNVTQMFNAENSSFALQHESLAVSVFIYRTEANGSLFYLDGALQNNV